MTSGPGKSQNGESTENGCHCRTHDRNNRIRLNVIARSQHAEMNYEWWATKQSPIMQRHLTGDCFVTNDHYYLKIVMVPRNDEDE